MRAVRDVSGEAPATITLNNGTTSPGISSRGPEYLIREPSDVYHAKSKQHLSSHQLAAFRDNPQLYRKLQQGMLPRGDRPAFQVGRGAHVLILEGRDAYTRQFAIGGPTNLFTGKAYHPRSREFLQWAQQQHKPVLTDSQAALIEEMAVSVHQHSIARDLLSEGVPEGVIRCDYRGVPSQARLDWLHPARGLVDLKTCEDLDGFERDARQFGYVHQMAFYRALLTLQTGDRCDVHLIAVEKRQTYRCGVWRIDPEILAVADRENEKAVERLLQCRHDDCWPTNYEDVRLLNQL